MKFILASMVCLASLAAQAVPVKVGSSPVISSAGIYLAQERNYFKEQGLEVELIDFKNSGAEMTVLLAKGELDVGAGNLSSGLFNAIAQGQNFKLVADKGHLEKGKDYIALIVRADHIASGRYKTLKDLKGFKMGLTALDGVSQQILAERFLAKAGLKSSDVEFVKLSYAEMNAALKAKTIDATIQLEPYIAKAEIDGIAKNVASGVEVHSSQQSAAVFYSPKFMADKDAATKFMIAYLKGVRDYNKAYLKNEGKAAVIADLKKHIKIEDMQVWEKMIPIGLTDNGSMDIKSLMNDIKWYQSKKYVPKVPTKEQIFDTSFAEQATKRLDQK